MHLHVRLMKRFPTVVIPGVTGMSGLLVRCRAADRARRRCVDGVAGYIG